MIRRYSAQVLIKSGFFYFILFYFFKSQTDSVQLPVLERPSCNHVANRRKNARFNAVGNLRSKCLRRRVWTTLGGEKHHGKVSQRLCQRKIVSGEQGRPLPSAGIQDNGPKTGRTRANG